MTLEEVIFRFRPWSILIRPSKPFLETQSPSANKNMAEVLRLSGLYDYEKQTDWGREAGMSSELHFLSCLGTNGVPSWTQTQVNLYRTPTSGERRIWISQMNRLVEPDELVAIGFARDAVSVAVNLSRFRDPDLLFELLNQHLGEPIEAGEEYPDQAEPQEVERAVSLVERFIRDSALTRQIKAIYDYKCQVCGERLIQSDGSPYAEGAHIKPLAEGGSDTLGNLLCLCPNDHVRFDRGGIYVDDHLVVFDRNAEEPIGELARVEEHEIVVSNFRAQKRLFE